MFNGKGSDFSFETVGQDSCGWNVALNVLQCLVLHVRTAPTAEKLLLHKSAIWACWEPSGPLGLSHISHRPCGFQDSAIWTSICYRKNPIIC